MASQILAINDPTLKAKLKIWREKQSESVSWEVE
jgi:phosphoribosylcarboxyaminoimidazole (NCAIR) mutase